MLYTLKDSMLLIDDFAPTGTSSDVAQLHKTAERVIRAKGNCQGRARCKSNGSVLNTKVPRALLLTTGEDIPIGRSLRPRMLTIQVRKGDIDHVLLKRCQKAANEGKFATLTATWIRWLAPRRDQVLKELATCQEHWKGEPMPPGMHPRTFMAVRELEFGFGRFQDFIREEKLAKERYLEWLEAMCRCTMDELAAAQQELVSDVDIVEQFASLLSTAFVGRQVHLENHFGAGGVPECDQRLWGWTSRTERVPINSDTNEDQHDGQGEHAYRETEIWIANGRRIGWVDEEFAYFDSGSLYGVLRKVCQEQGKSFAVTEAVLRKRLVERGWAIPDTVRQKNLQRITVDGERRDVLQIDILKLRSILRFPGSHADETNGTMEDLLIA